MKQYINSIEWIQMANHLQNIRAFYRNISHGSGKMILNQAELEILSFIWINDNCSSPLDITKSLGIHKENVSRTLKKLISNGLIIKEVCECDKRRSYVKLTETGIDLLDINYTQFLSPIYELKRELGEEKFKTFINLINESNNIFNK